jgi:hypothetical protein
LARLGRQSQARAVPTGKKGVRTPKAPPGFILEGALARPDTKHLSPTRGKRVGGVSGRPTRLPGGEILTVSRESRRWKAPGLRNGGVLRGKSSERRSWSVWLERRGLLLGVGTHRRHKGALRTPRRGTSSARRQQSASTRRESAKNATHASKTRPSLGPKARACQSSLRSSRRKPSRGEAVEIPSRSGKPRKRKNRHRGEHERTERGSPHAYRSRKGGRVARREKEGGCGLRPCEDLESSGEVPARRKQSLQKSIGDVRPRIGSRRAPQKGWRRE